MSNKKMTMIQRIETTGVWYESRPNWAVRVLKGKNKYVLQLSVRKPEMICQDSTFDDTDALLKEMRYYAPLNKWKDYKQGDEKK